MNDRLNQLLQSLPRHGANVPCRDSCWEPAADVYQTANGWLLKFDLAGVNPQDVAVRVDGNRLTVRGSRRDQVNQSGASYYRMEISYSTFQRTVVLPMKNTVVFPFTFSPLAVGRPLSLAAVEAALASEEKTVLLPT